MKSICQHIVYGALSEIVVDTKDVGLVEYTEQDVVQLPRRGQILPKGLLDDDASASTAIGLVQISTTVSNRIGGIAI